MYRFIESICIIDRNIRNPELHRDRMNCSRYKFLGMEEKIDPEEIIHAHDIPSTGKYKCRIVYGTEVESIEFIPYRVRNINSIRLVENNFLNYRYKFLNRDAFELLKDSVAEDEILIVKNGQITDTSYSNVIFFDGKKWVTPSTCLLNGIMRQRLLNSGEISEENISFRDMDRFTSFKLINAMMNPEESPELDISIIR